MASQSIEAKWWSLVWANMASRSVKVKVWSLIWANMAPQSVEAFVWQLTQGRVAVKIELVRRNMMTYDPTKCSLCNCGDESVDHLFVGRFKVWRV
ncbi:Uncharacterized protein TCM_035229 [Theobroma cacao]|uniref:Reverse transcriptase zinc-binding domain-containing protein n=1 Tax=Theobroma cacao TaxID=3641 RepID=A0A061FPK6_THECC|nr:Uncharacterized protein TCM_035229 [Theobroma cacao]